MTNNKLLHLVRLLRNETRPIDKHPDPGAIQDKWNELIKLIGEGPEIINNSIMKDIKGFYDHKTNIVEIRSWIRNG